MTQVIIIGAGIFGSVLARALSQYVDVDVTMVDSGEPLAASKAAGCVIKREWAKGLSDDEFKQALHDLKYLYEGGVVEHGNGFYTIDPRVICCEPFINDRIVSVDPESGVAYSEIMRKYEGILYVAAGYHTTRLIPGLNMKGGMGSALICEGEVEGVRVDSYLPYKQNVWFTRQDGKVWFGDGTAIKHANYRPHHTTATAQRAEAQGLSVIETLHGVRPYLNQEPGKPGFYRKLSDKCVVATGGAKIGSQLAPLFAARFIREMI